MILFACLVLLVALGIWERAATRRARAAVPIRVHVNGTRGKSTVTRLVAGALREAGVPTLAKVTGTAPRLILPDGSEQAVVRRAPPSIREQGWLMRRAAREGARAVVAECMAIRPDLQWTSEREMLHATIGVITNARLDHTDVMGRTLEEIAQSLANSIPRGSVLVTGDERLHPLLSGRCAAAGTRLVVAEHMGQVGQVGQVGAERPWMLENVATALAVTRELGVEDGVALRGMQKAAPDPGAADGGTVTIVGRQAAWVDATAANDPESLDLLVTGLKPGATTAGGSATTAASDAAPSGSSGIVARGLSPAKHLVCVYNHRADRPLRLLAFAKWSDVFRGSAAILLTGDRPSLSLVARVRRLCAGADLRFVTRKRLEATIEEVLGGASSTSDGASPASGRTSSAPADDRRRVDSLIAYCGNTRGWTRPLWLTRERPGTRDTHQEPPC